MSCHWNDLGKINKPGSYLVSNVGEVQVIQEDIDRAAELGGNPQLTLEDVFVRNAKERHYAIRFMRPDPLANYRYYSHTVSNTR